MNLNELKLMKITDLLNLAKDLNVENARGLRKQELIFAILQAQTEQNGFIYGEGVLQVLPEGFGFLRAPDTSYLPGSDDIYVSPSQIRRFNLRTGDTVSGQIRPPKDGERYFALLKVETINYEDPDNAKLKTLFDNLTPLYPDEVPKRIRSENYDRVIDLLCPLGEGQRTLVVAAPQNRQDRSSCRALARDRDEPQGSLSDRPADRRTRKKSPTWKGRSRARSSPSTFDEPAARHVQVAEMVIRRPKRLVEHRRDVVITYRLHHQAGRAYNTVVPPSAKILSGGVDSNALHKPKRFFGAARNIETAAR